MVVAALLAVVRAALEVKGATGEGITVASGHSHSNTAEREAVVGRGDPIVGAVLLRARPSDS